MINGDNQGPANLGGKNVYLVTPPTRNHQIPPYNGKAINHFNVNSSMTPENGPHKRMPPTRYKVDDGGQAKNPGKITRTSCRQFLSVSEYFHDRSLENKIILIDFSF